MKRTHILFGVFGVEFESWSPNTKDGGKILLPLEDGKGKQNFK